MNLPSATTVLGYAFVAAPYAAAAILGLLLPLLAVLAYSRFGVGVSVIVGMFVVEAVLIDVGGLQLGIALYPTDLVLLFVAAVAVLRLLLARDAPRRHWSWFVFGAALFFSLMVGLIMSGTAAGVQARPYFYLLVSGTYAMTFTIDARRASTMLQLLAAAAAALLLLTAYRWLVYYLPIRDLLPEGGAYNIDSPIRVIRSHEALLLVEVLVLGLFAAGAARGLVVARAFSPLLLGAVVALQHRSVWVAGIVGVVASLVGGRARRGSIPSQLFVIAAVAFATALPLLLSDRLSGLSGQIAASADSALSGTGTAGERVESWGAIVDKWQAGGARSVLVGQPFGSDPSRYVHDQERGGLRKISYTAHNFYVQTLFNLGLLGLGAFVVAAVYTLRGLYRACADPIESAHAQALLVLVAAQLAYYVPYGADYLQSLIFGTALAWVATRERRAAAKEWQETLPQEPSAVRTRWA